MSALLSLGAAAPGGGLPRRRLDAIDWRLMLDRSKTADWAALWMGVETDHPQGPTLWSLWRDGDGPALIGAEVEEGGFAALSPFRPAMAIYEAAIRRRHGLRAIGATTEEVEGAARLGPLQPGVAPPASLRWTPGPDGRVSGLRFTSHAADPPPARNRLAAFRVAGRRRIGAAQAQAAALLGALAAADGTTIDAERALERVVAVALEAIVALLDAAGRVLDAAGDPAAARGADRLREEGLRLTEAIWGVRLPRFPQDDRWPADALALARGWGGAAAIAELDAAWRAGPAVDRLRRCGPVDPALAARNGAPETAGDCADRLSRMLETATHFAAFDAPDPPANGDGALRAEGAAVMESGFGPALAAIAVSGETGVDALHLRDPLTVRGWVFEVAAEGARVEDLPLIGASLGLASVSGAP